MSVDVKGVFFPFMDLKAMCKTRLSFATLIKMEANKSRVMKTEVQISSVGMYSLSADFEGI